VADVKGKLDKSNESNKDKDELGGTTGAFAILLADTDDVDGTNKTYFTLVTSLLFQTTLAILVKTTSTLINDLNSILLIY
jgi:hypothetical protein